jgi:proteic killer suppression protein
LKFARNSVRAPDDPMRAHRFVCVPPLPPRHAVASITCHVVRWACDSSKETEELFRYRHSRQFRSFERVALRKLLQLPAATELRALASRPGNQLDALCGDRKGQHSICVNDLWRICFVWRDGHCYDVEIVDYH